MSAPPRFYDDLEASLTEAWRRLSEGAADRQSGFHHAVAATIGRDGRPRARTVIVRACDQAARLLRFHTDRRSEKMSELQADPRIALHFYDPPAKIQLRVEGVASLETSGAAADAAWAASQLKSRACYGQNVAPGREIDTPRGVLQPVATEAATAAGRANFLAVLVRIEELDWYYLDTGGHRRARFRFETDGTMRAVWLAP